MIMVFYTKSQIPKTAPAVAPPVPRIELVDVNKVTSKKTLVLKKRIVNIGRDPNNDIVIPKDTVSSLHATIEYRDGFFYLEDQRSKNKTYLNGEEIEPHSLIKLKSGDEITFNVYKFKFILPHLIPAGETLVNFSEKSETLIRSDTAPGPPDSATRTVPPIPQAMLIDVKNITTKKTFALSKSKISIGRDSNNDIPIPEDTVSGFHATIEYKDGFFCLEDQRSKNKTYLNGKEIETNSPIKLKSGDEITFDIYKFIFLLERQLPSGDTDERG